MTKEWLPPAPAAPSLAPPASSAALPPPSWLAPLPENSTTFRETTQNVAQDHITQNTAASPPSSWPGLPALPSLWPCWDPSSCPSPSPPSHPSFFFCPSSFCLPQLHLEEHRVGQVKCFCFIRRTLQNNTKKCLYNLSVTH